MKKSDFIKPPNDNGISDSFYDEINYGFEYDYRDCKIDIGDRVLDCGAYIGMFTEYAYRMGAEKVYSVEMDGERFECLKQNLGKIQLGAKSTQPIPLHLEVSDKDTSVEHLNVGVFLENNNIDFIKMDIEGMEWPVLLNMKDEHMCLVNKWAIEVHLGWSKDSRKWTYGRDFDGHLSNKLISVIEKFSRNGFNIGFRHPHPEWSVAMLYAWK